MNSLIKSQMLDNETMELVIPSYFLDSQTVVIDRSKAVNWIVKIGRNAKVSFREVGLLVADCFNINLILEEETEVDYYVDEIFFEDADKCELLRLATLSKAASLVWYGATMGVNTLTTKTVSNIVGEGAKSNFYWLGLVEGRQNKNVVLTNRFDAPNCSGQIWMKGVAKDYSEMLMCGNIEITLAGKATDSYLKEDTLILDKTAKLRAMPCLEIKTNDVKAGHGATVTNVGGEDIFYLQSRGIASEIAKKLIVDGFLLSGLGNCQDQYLVEKVSQRVLGDLNLI